MTAAGIGRAGAVVDPVFRNSPQLMYDGVNRLAGAEVLLKIETLNPIRSFKGRGADYYVHCLPDETPLVLASAGNFGQGMSYAARKRGLPITIFAATNANELKVARMRELGADVILAGGDFDAAKTAAREHGERMGWRYVEDGREAAIAEGAGTIAIELLQWPRTLDTVVVPVGNGALINGIGTWMKAHSAGTRVIGVCAAGAPSMERSWRAKEVITTEAADTFADGIAVRTPVAEALDVMYAVVDDVMLVDDASVLDAMSVVLQETGIVVEPAGAVGMAAILNESARFAGMHVATVLTGGNYASRR